MVRLMDDTVQTRFRLWYAADNVVSGIADDARTISESDRVSKLIKMAN